MFITIKCQKCGRHIMHENVDLGVTTTKAGVWLIVSGYCKPCNKFFSYYFKEDQKREDPCQKK
jgi:hypothetical protein